MLRALRRPFAVLLAALLVSSALAPDRMGMHGRGGDMDPIHVLLTDHEAIERRVVDRPDGVETLYAGTTHVNGFAFRAGQDLPAHSAPAEAFLLVTEGAARVTVGDAVHPLSAGDGIALPADVPHALTATADARCARVRAR